LIIHLHQYTKFLECGTSSSVLKLRQIPRRINYLYPEAMRPGKGVNFCFYTNIIRSRDTVVGIAAGRPRGRSSSPGRVNNFLFSKFSRPALRTTQPPIQWVPEALSQGVKRPGREVDNSPATSAEVIKMCSYASTPIRLHGVVLN
jgi:hypothetical protein